MSKIVLSCYILALNALVIRGNPIKKDYRHYLKVPAVKKFQEYLQIDTSQVQNLQYAVDFIRQQAEELNLPFAVFETEGGKTICIITVEGTDPTLPTIMLNSHMDVVPADAKEWTYPPFEAHMDESGDIFARGAQDTKDIAIQYLEAIRKFKHENVTLLRTLHVTFMPDEETGGFQGIKQFVNTEDFRKLNVGFALDEGFTSTDENLVYPMYQDKRPWQMQFTVHGQGGHGFTLTNNSAVGNAVNMINKITEYRTQQMDIINSRSKTDFGAYTSVNVNILKSNRDFINVIASEVNVGVDMRLSTDSIIHNVEKMVKSWMAAAGNDTEIIFIRREEKSAKTPVDDSNPYWVAFKQALADIHLNYVPIVCPATSDMVVLRNKGIPAIGFSAKMKTEGRLHGVDEYLNVEVFLRGIDIYYEVIRAVANVKPELHFSHDLQVRQCRGKK